MTETTVKAARTEDTAANNSKEQWYDSLTELMNMGFDLDKNSARVLLGSVNELISIRQKQAHNKEAFNEYKSADKSDSRKAFFDAIHAFMVFSRYLVETNTATLCIYEDVDLSPCAIYANANGETLEDALALLNATAEIIESLIDEAWCEVCTYAHSPEAVAEDMLGGIDKTLFRAAITHAGPDEIHEKFMEHIENYFMREESNPDEGRYNSDDELFDAFFQIARYVSKEHRKAGENKKD